MRFVLIVWSVALGFQVLVGGAARIVAWAFDNDLIHAPWAMPNVTPDCGRVAAAAPPTTIDPATILPLVFQLGLSVGVETGIRNAGQTAPNSTMKADREGIALRLGVSTPEVPPVIHAATAMNDFGVFLQKDPQCVATRLTAAYGPASGALFQFAAVAGHAWVYRTYVPGNPVFVPQLRFYGDRAGVPPELWAALRADLSARSAEQARSELSQTMASLLRHFERAPPPGGPTSPPR